MSRLMHAPMSTSRDEHPDCTTCSSLVPLHALYSLGDRELLLVSTHHPDDATYAAVKTACTKSLSSEVTPGREGAILFGSDSQSVFSYVFKVFDAQARGHARWYSFTLVGLDRILLVAGAELLIRLFQSMARLIQSHSDTEQYSLEVTPVRMLRQPAFLSNIRGLGLAGQRASLAKRATLAPLPQLLKDPLFFARLHLQFCTVFAALEKLILHKRDHPCLNVKKHTHHTLAFSIAHSLTGTELAAASKRYRITRLQLVAVRTLISDRQQSNQRACVQRSHRQSNHRARQQLRARKRDPSRCCSAASKRMRKAARAQRELPTLVRVQSAWSCSECNTA